MARVSFEFKKGDFVWIGLVVVLLCVGLGVAYTYDGSGNPEIMGHSADELQKCSSGQILKSDESGDWVCSNLEERSFGTWTDKDSSGNNLVKGIVYKSTSDGFVTVYGVANTIISGYTGSSNPPVTKVLYSPAGGYDYSGAITMPVKKDYYWKVDGTNKIYWLPIGSGSSIKQ